MAICTAAGAVALNIAFPLGSVTLAIVGAAVLFVGLGSIGRMILTETDEEWEHTPEFHGFRPAATTG
jgi:hypothetical protein